MKRVSPRAARSLCALIESNSLNAPLNGANEATVISPLHTEEGDEEGERSSSGKSEDAGLDFELEDEAYDEKDAVPTGRASADHPGWAALNTTESGPGGRGPVVAGDADKMDAAKIRRLSAYLGDSLSLGRALSTPIADPPQLTVRRNKHVLHAV